MTGMPSLDPQAMPSLGSAVILWFVFLNHL